jgi:hypothetical protein
LQEVRAKLGRLAAGGPATNRWSFDHILAIYPSTAFHLSDYFRPQRLLKAERSRLVGARPALNQPG